MHNILLIQNDSAGAGALRDALTYSSDGSFRVLWVRRCAEGLRVLGRRKSAEKPHAARIAAILVDLFLPDSSGIETFDKLFQAMPEVPILVLTAPQDEPVAKSAVQRGAQEYFLKDRLDAYLWPKAVASMIERAANLESLYEAKDRAQVTLNSIGDAVLSTDMAGKVTYLNVVAESLTGWSQSEAAGHPLEEVFRIIDGASGSPQSDVACDSGKQDAGPHSKLRIDTPRRDRIPRRRFGGPHSRSTRAGHRCRHGVSRRKRSQGDHSQNVIPGAA